MSDDAELAEYEKKWRSFKNSLFKSQLLPEMRFPTTELKLVFTFSGFTLVFLLCGIFITS